jgi:hypothetical protein
MYCLFGFSFKTLSIIGVEGEMWLGKLKTEDSIAYFCGARLNMTGVVYNRCEMVRPGRVFEGVKNIYCGG